MNDLLFRVPYDFSLFVLHCLNLWPIAMVSLPPVSGQHWLWPMRSALLLNLCHSVWYSQVGNVQLCRARVWRAAHTRTHTPCCHTVCHSTCQSFWVLPSQHEHILVRGCRRKSVASSCVSISVSHFLKLSHAVQCEYVPRATIHDMLVHVWASI